MSKVREIIKNYEKKFENYMFEDMGTNNSISTLFEFIKEIKKLELSTEDKTEVKNFVKKIDNVLGCNFFKKEEKVIVSKKIFELAEKRVQYKKNKEFQKADKIREEVKNLGFKIIDVDDTFKIEKL